jgi:hypothetical protein
MCGLRSSTYIIQINTFCQYYNFYLNQNEAFPLAAHDRLAYRKEKDSSGRMNMNADVAAFPDRETIADKLSGFSEGDQAFVRLLMENAQQDENLLEGLALHLHRASEARFLNSLKLEKLGEWLGNTAPARLQIRLMETARSSQHAAYAAYRAGLTRSGGLERAYPKV